MTWNAFHNRGETLRTVITLVDERRDGVLPWHDPGVAEHFVDERDLVGALLLKWHARLSGNIERAIGQQPTDLAEAVVDAWRTTAEQMPGVRLVVDRCAVEGGAATRECVQRARERERARLALAAGLASGATHEAVAVGTALEERARVRLTGDAGGVPTESIPAQAGRTPARRRTPQEADVNPKHSKKHQPTQDEATTSPDTESHEQANTSLVDRIKAALAAA